MIALMHYHACIRRFENCKEAINSLEAFERLSKARIVLDMDSDSQKRNGRGIKEEAQLPSGGEKSALIERRRVSEGDWSTRYSRQTLSSAYLLAAE